MAEKDETSGQNGKEQDESPNLKAIEKELQKILLDPEVIAKAKLFLTEEEIAKWENRKSPKVRLVAAPVCAHCSYCAPCLATPTPDLDVTLVLFSAYFG